MSASCNFTLKFKGNELEFFSLCNMLILIEGNTVLENDIWDHYNEHKISLINNWHNIWGEYYLHPDIEMYLTLAKTVYNSEFSVTSNREYMGCGGCYTNFDGDYKAGMLDFLSEEYSDDDGGYFDALIDSVADEYDCAVEDVTYEQFCEYYIVGEDITEERFNRYMEDMGFLEGAAFSCEYDSKNGKYILSLNDYEPERRGFVYSVESDGTIKNKDGAVDEKMMKAVQRYEKNIFEAGENVSEAVKEFRNGLAYQVGLAGKERDEEKTFACYSKAAEMGCGKAIVMIALYHFYGEAGLQPDKEQAKLWLKKATETEFRYADKIEKALGL